MQKHIEKIILEGDEISWKDILQNLVKSEEMDPWDIDLTLLTQKFIHLISKMQEADLRISGKMCLAAAMLLKLKTKHLLEHDIAKLDELLSQSEDDEYYDEMGEWDEETRRTQRQKEKLPLVPRNPQPRSRKVSIHDLVDALQKAMATRRKKLERDKPAIAAYELMPDSHINALELVIELYNKITYYSKKKNKEELSFKELLPPKAKKQDKSFTFIPLLQLENEKRIITKQAKPFDEVYVALRTKKQEAILKKKIKKIEEQEAEEIKRKSSRKKSKKGSKKLEEKNSNSKSSKKTKQNNKS